MCVGFSVRTTLAAGELTLNRAGAMPALLCRHGDRHRALWAILRCHRRRRLWHPPVHRAHQQENRKRHDHEIDDGVDEIAVIERGCPGRLGRSQRFERFVAQIDEKVGKVHVPPNRSTIFPKAAPRITPTARSRTFPRMANSLNSFNTVVLLSKDAGAELRPAGWCSLGRREACIAGDYSRIGTSVDAK